MYDDGSGAARKCEVAGQRDYRHCFSVCYSIAWRSWSQRW